MSATSLADLLGVSPATISSYEHGRQKPPVEVVEKLASILNVSAHLFSLEPPKVQNERIFFRSMSSATKVARNRAKRRYEWLQEIAQYLSEFFDFPKLDIPDCNLPIDFCKIDSLLIEEAAAATRKYWGLPAGPAPNLVRLAESKGIVVSRGKLDAEGLDAFSQWSTSGLPFVFLGSDKASAVRSRFDIAHEIGHLILHRHVVESALSSTKDYKIIEMQANRFASAFLLPAKDFATDLYAPTLDAFRLLKPRWKVSIGAMIKRSGDLSLVDEDQSRRLWINMNRRGWRTEEPMDDTIEPESPSLLSQCVGMMVSENFKSKNQIVSDICLSGFDIEELCGLRAGYLVDGFEVVLRPKFGADNIIGFAS
jgi:Zn-dependent peptidase ImmA (M78 family)/transcriptional regulator with XRE-family HTH domain